MASHTRFSDSPGRFGKQDFRYIAEEDVYVCPAGERLDYYYTTEDKGLVVHRYATNANVGDMPRPLSRKADAAMTWMRSILR